MCTDIKYRSFRILLVSFMPLWFGWACTDDKSVSEIRMVEEYFAKVSSQDYELLHNYLRPDVIEYHASDLAPPAETKPEIIKMWKLAHDQFQDLKFERIGIGVVEIDSGDYQGRWVSDYLLMKANFRGYGDFTVKTHIMYKIVEGRISQIRNFTNVNDALKQAGFVQRFNDEAN